MIIILLIKVMRDCACEYVAYPTYIQAAHNGHKNVV